MGNSPGIRAGSVLLDRYELREPAPSQPPWTLLAWDRHLSRDVWIAPLPEAARHDPGLVAGRLLEARRLAAIEDPRLPTPLDIVADESAPFAVLPKLDGETLKQRLARAERPPLSPPDLPIPLSLAQRIVRDTALALSAAHEAGVAHGGLTLASVFLTNANADGTHSSDFPAALLFDFAFADRPLASRHTPSRPRSSGSNLRASGPSRDTDPELPPHPRPAGRLSSAERRTDLRAFGELALELLTGGRDPTAINNATPDLPKATADALRLCFTPPETLPSLAELARSFDGDARADDPPHDDAGKTRPTPTPIPAASSVASSEPTSAAPLAMSSSPTLTPLPFPAQASTPSSATLPAARSGGFRRSLAWVGVGAALVLAAVLLVRHFASPRIASLAVLPFSSESGDTESEYLSDGVTESLINALARIERLRVPARSTVFRLKGKAADPQQAGRDLKVDAVVTGRILNRDGVLLVRVEMLRVKDGAQLWGERFDRKTGDLLTVQEEIARQISDRLRVRLTGDEERHLARRPTADPEAYQLYLRGRFFWSRRSEDGIRRAIDSFKQAIEKDPTFALAHSGLADAYNVLPFWGLSPPSEAFPLAKAAAHRAHTLDPTLAEGHTSLAYSTFYFDHDPVTSEKEFREALEKNPTYVTAHHWYGVMLALSGRFSEAEDHLRRALRLDPLSLIANADLALVHYFAGDPKRAVEEAKKTIELDPSFTAGHLYLGLALNELGKTDAAKRPGAIQALERAVEVSGSGTAPLAALGHAYGKAGRAADARALHERLVERAKTRYVSLYHMAVVEAGEGRLADALSSLQAAETARSETLVWARVDPRLADLKAEPRFQALLARLNRASTSTPPARP